MTNRIHILSAALLLAGCSSAMSQEVANTAVISQGSGVDYAAALDGAPPVEHAPAPLGPPAVIAIAPVTSVELAVAKPVVVKKVQKFTCDIEISRTSRGLRVTPVVHANRSLSGDFTLVVTKDGAGGSSDISQGGEFDARRGERVELSSSEFSMERGAKFRAVLKVRAGGNEVCRDIRS